MVVCQAAPYLNEHDGRVAKLREPCAQARIDAGQDRRGDQRSDDFTRNERRFLGWS